MENEKRSFKKFEQLLRVQIGETRWLVMSRTIDNKISMVQQIKIKNYKGEDEYLFLKNAFIFESMEFFEEFRDELLNAKVEE